MTVGFSSIALIALAEGDVSSLAGATGPDLTRYLLVCGLLVVLIAGIGLGFRRLLAGNLRARAAKRSLHVLDVLPLGGKQRLAVVRCYDQSFLIGVGDKHISLIADLGEPGGEPQLELAQAEPGDPSAVGHTAGGFLRSLRQEERRVRAVPEVSRSRPHHAIGGGKGILG